MNRTSRSKKTSRSAAPKRAKALSTQKRRSFTARRTPTASLTAADQQNIAKRRRSIPGALASYVLRMKLDNGQLQFYFTKGPASQGSPADPRVDIQVFKDCTISIELDPDVKWKYRQENGITLGSGGGVASRYYNLSKSNSYRLAQFGADYFHNGGNNLDHFNVHLVLDTIKQHAGRGRSGRRSESQPTYICIDPDIQNPGGHG